MKYRDPKKDGDSFGMIEHRQSVLKTVEGVNKLDEVIDWELFREELESVLGYAHRDPTRGGRPPFDAVPMPMLKVLVLQRTLRSRIRVRCEHVFGRTTQMAMDRLRTIGLPRAGQHNGLCNLVYNMDRYAFLCR